MFSADVRASFQVAFSLSVNFLEIRKLIYVLEMVIAPPPPPLLSPHSKFVITGGFNLLQWMRNPGLFRSVAVSHCTSIPTFILNYISWCGLTKCIEKWKAEPTKNFKE